MSHSNEPPICLPGWESSDAVRLVDPDGAQVAWVSPAHGGNTFAFLVWTGSDWRNVLFDEGPLALATRPTRFGCPVLFPFPGHVRDAHYTWQGIRRALPINGPDGQRHVHGFAHDRPWHVVEAQPNAVTLEFATERVLTRTERAAYPFDIVLRQVVRLEGSILAITLTAHNAGRDTAPVGLGLHPYIDPSLFGRSRGSLKASLPGTHDRVLDGAIPTGELRAVTSDVVELPETGNGLLLCRTNLGHGATATLDGPRRGRVELSLISGWTDLVLFVPPDQPSVALEPLACALSAASLPVGNYGRLPALAPGETVSAGVSLRYVNCDE